MDGHPVRLVVADDLQRSRLTVFFRLLLALPHFVWIGLWSFAVLVIGLVAWVAALVRGRLPRSLHEFFAMYVRYVTHVSGYISLAANPFPGFTGQPGYPIDVELPEAPERQSRWSIGLRLLLALPALLLAGALGTGGGGNSGGVGVAAVCALLGWFAILALGRMPLGLRNLAAYGLGYTAQAYAYVLLLTDRYPNSDPDAVGPAWALPPHPVTVEVADDLRRSRLTVLFRLLLTTPHFFWLGLWSVAAFLAAIANGFVALFRGRSAEPLHRFLSAYVRYYAQVTAFVSLVANPFPGFVGAPGYPVDITIGPPERQNRWVTFFRVILAIPAFVLAGALGVVLLIVSLLAWFAALATGRMPAGLRNLGAYVIRYHSQTNAYWFVVTDSYPHASPALRPPPEPKPVWADPFQPLPEAV